VNRRQNPAFVPGFLFRVSVRGFPGAKNKPAILGRRDVSTRIIREWQNRPSLAGLLNKQDSRLR
jgi:hypothetical protein